MAELILHIGAHRTGTTSLQQFLRENTKLLEEAGIQLAYPPHTRNHPLSQVRITQPRAIVSEENILGIMEENISTAMLYPSAFRYLARHGDLLKRASKVFLTVRCYDEWWISAITFCAKRGVELPDQSLIDKMASLNRTWNDVVDDVVAAAPQAEIIVREFEWKRSTPKQHLNKLTGWPEWAATNLERRVHNQRPSLAEIAEVLLDKKDFAGLSRLPQSDDYQPFSQRQVDHLRQSYISDIDRLRTREDIHFWGEALPARKVEAKEPLLSKSVPSRVLLHIGKTGGTYLKSVVANKAPDIGQLVLCGHGDTLISTARAHGRTRKLAFLFRDPAERFVSGFNSRLRQGRPTYDVVWTPAEGVAFSFFAHPNDLAEALDGKDERLRSASYFAFKNIFHLKHDYRHFLHSSEALRYEHGLGNIIVCCETPNIAANMERILNTLGVRPEKHNPIRHESIGDQDTSLSERALANLKRHLQAEYEIYRTCRAIAKDLGFD